MGNSRNKKNINVEEDNKDLNHIQNQKESHDLKLNIKNFQWLKKVKEYESKSLYFAIIAFVFMFYILAHIFFYGYYFGGDSKKISSMLQVIINPVPFNFKSLTMLGIFLMLIVIVFVILFIKITQSLEEKSKFIVVDLILLGVVNVCIYACFVIIFKGEADFIIEEFKVWLLPMFFIVLFALVKSKQFRSLGYGLLGVCNIIFFISIIQLIVNHEIIPRIYGETLIGIWLILSLFSTCFNLKKVIIYPSIFFGTYICTEVVLNLYNFSINTLSLCLIILILFYCIKKLCEKKIKIFNNIIYEKLIKNSKMCIQVNDLLHFIVSKLESFFKSIGDRYKFLMVTIWLLSLIVTFYFTPYLLGQSMGNSLTIDSSSEIRYYSKDFVEEPNIIIGNIVAYKDNVFYISNQNRELIILKNSTVKMKPYVERKEEDNKIK